MKFDDKLHKEAKMLTSFLTNQVRALSPEDSDTGSDRTVRINIELQNFTFLSSQMQFLSSLIDFSFRLNDFSFCQRNYVTKFVTVWS